MTRQEWIILIPLSERNLPDWVLAIKLLRPGIDDENINTVVQGLRRGIDPCQQLRAGFNDKKAICVD